MRKTRKQICTKSDVSGKQTIYHQLEPTEKSSCNKYSELKRKIPQILFTFKQTIKRLHLKHVEQRKYELFHNGMDSMI